MMKNWLILLVIWGSQQSAMKIENRKFIDAQGRQIIYRGPNVVVKVPPYMPNMNEFNTDNSFTKQDLQLCREWGFNSIRLGVMWAGVQPQKDKYNETYLQQMLDLVNLAGKYGIHTLVQFHQDLLAEKFCGDGVPTWLIDQIKGYKTFPFPIGLKKIPLNASGLPDWSNCRIHQWASFYLSYDVGESYNQLYNPKHKLNHKFRAYWKKVASVFKNNPNVIAYELINQPWVGNLFRNPSLFIGPIAQLTKFQQFYDILSQDIRQVDPLTPICFEPLNFDNKLYSGFSHPPGGKKYSNVSIMCYHYYNPPAISVNTIKYRIRDAKRLNISSMLSEFQADQNAIEIADSNLQSWMVWGYKQFGKNWGMTAQDQNLDSMFISNGEPNIALVAQRSRTYMQLTAGKLISSIYKTTNKYFNAVYQAKPAGTSILYLNKKYNYPYGYEIQLIPVDLMTYEQTNGYISINYKGSQPRKVMITINKL